MAIIKDYYRILNIQSSASPAEIKNAYRKLAMAYHPDRNPNDTLAAAVFTDVAEAYKILSDEETRKQYNYERYLTAEQEYRRPVETIDTLIQRMAKINKQVKNTDPFRLNKDALLYSVKQLLPDDTGLLMQTNETSFRQFVEMICNAAEHLSSHQTNQLITLLQPLYTKHAWLQQRLTASLLQQRKDERWQKNKIVLAIVLAIALCIIIFFAASA
ncbi:MAG TPA: DnaJ domain-containing protein [Parafilimonas sp.]|nr:DnaJ domain-containing protein [Parafilimonas sp.]